MLSNRNPEWAQCRQVARTTGTWLLEGSPLMKPARWQEPSLSGGHPCARGASPGREGGREGRVGTDGLGLNPWFQDAPRSWPPHSRRRARPLRNSGVGMAQETCCKRTSLAPRPPETWAGDLWDDSIVRISALGLASGCSGAAAGSLTAQTTARVSRAQPWEALCYLQGLTAAGAGGTAAQVTAVTWSQPWTPCQALCQALPCATTL